MSRQPEIVKIVVTGPENAGKTTLIQSVDQIDALTSRIPNTDIGRLVVDNDLLLYIISPPNTRSYDFIWEQPRGTLGLVVIVDSTDPNSFRETRNIIETFRAYAPFPFVVAANKQDHHDAWDPAAMRIILRLPRKVPLVPCIATQPMSVRKVLISLLYTVLDDEEAYY
jgi:hypothetical protein